MAFPSTPSKISPPRVFGEANTTSTSTAEVSSKPAWFDPTAFATNDYDDEPASPTKAEPMDFGYVSTPRIKTEWECLLPQHAKTWDAIAELDNPKVLTSTFGATDACKKIAEDLGIDIDDIYRDRLADSSGKQRAAVVRAILDFCASPSPDTHRLDHPNCPISMRWLLSAMDRDYSPLLDRLLPMMLTLLMLRHIKAGSRFDNDVLGHYAADLGEQAKSASKEEENQYARTQSARKNFLRESNAGAEAYRLEKPPSKSPPLSDPVEEALTRIGQAYSLDLTLHQKEEIGNALTKASGVQAEVAADVTPVLRRLIDWYESPAATRGSPPPLGQLLALLPPLGWYHFHDQKCETDRTTVALRLTGHPALPDALEAAIREQIAAQRGVDRSLLSTAGPAAPVGLYDCLQEELSLVDQVTPGSDMHALERAIGRSGPNLLQRMAADPQAVNVLTAELQDSIPGLAKCARMVQALQNLSALLRAVVQHSKQSRQMVMLELYRKLGQPLGNEARERALHQVAARHPELDPAELAKLAGRFAETMSAHGYCQGDAQALAISVAAAHAHWESSASAKNDLEKLHDESLAAFLRNGIDKARLKAPPAKPERLLNSPANALIAMLRDHYGFSREMLAQLQQDLVHYHSKANVDERFAIERRYTSLLGLGSTPLDAKEAVVATQKLIGALHEHLAIDTPLSERLAPTLDRLLESLLPVSHLMQMLGYFWRMQALVPEDSRAKTLLNELDSCKVRLCQPEGQPLDLGKACEFNNAVREALVKTLSDRVPGFGIAYVAEFESCSEMSYEGLVENMQNFLKGWSMPAKTW
ncbi:hypothetical protein [Xylophilus sp. GOD-11R]|uniref:hypothetical protein n=1 Tax=Xylophilus sp. GOD-11R TaxID=3089814 RepID=UPI00298C73DD|nr:hypothetical protein [Xylophilus sp. GOD-11R]WPB54923.1 hypothetical protein R9X41_12135 [Xylophilus sp. GOD-11R]